MNEITTTGGIVYLLHFGKPFTRAGHYLGVVESEAGIAVDSVTIPHGRGRRSTAAVDVQVADVWETTDLPAAEALREKFKKQGSRKRLCSVCTPGNDRGGGRGKYPRKGRKLLP